MRSLAQGPRVATVKLAEEASPRIRTQPNPEARKALLNIEHEQAVSKANFAKPYDDSARATPLGAEPLLLARIQTGHDPNGHPVVAMHPAEGQGVTLTLGNVLCGIGMAAAGFGPIFGAISRNTPPEKRSIALGVAPAGGSFGQFAIVPLASLLQYRLGNWHTTMLILGVMSMVMVPLAFGLRE